MLSDKDATPVLSTRPPFLEAAGDLEAQRFIAKAALLSEPRVRELIALALEAAAACDSIEPGSGARIVDRELHALKAKLHALEYGLGGLLPPVTGRLNIPLDAAVLGHLPS